ncbi:auxin-responsive protein IAA7-like isoform X2 [Phalaenopsis equestris]|uniref:auxin-responsive protein IAA7-like isoform X2 n=1 Tax=Phalaenopsis equestris TaxID=78828 RepID=UPI0009E27992|nr:auxin-responsive protein IAA7-like isoform X2 [Phalaenopsis equestris]
MESEFRKRGGECPQLLDLISVDDWLKRDAGGGGKSLGASEEKKLELTLAPPGGEGWPAAEEEQEKLTSNRSSTCFSNFSKSFDKKAFFEAKMGFLDTAEPKKEGFQQQQRGPLQLQLIAGLSKESPVEANGMMEQTHLIRAHASSDNVALVKSSTQIRATTSPVVGWPPIRSFRKNIAITSTKQSNELKNGVRENVLKGNTSKKGLFVKINMDGIPIGRKLDLNACENYQKLCSIVEELFCGLLAAQRDPTASGSGISESERMAFTGLLDVSGEYSLVYEDNEGDRMMVGDVPWDMFVSTAKRLRVLKNSELSASSKQSSRVLS